jgi:3-methylcrotonyl-CoA carboxylase alpha subunit
MRNALAQCEIDGPKSNIAFLERLVRHPAVVEARIDSGYLDRNLDEFVSGAHEPDAHTLYAAATAILLHDEARSRVSAVDPHSPWAVSDAWRIGRNGKRVLALARGEARFELEAWGHAGRYILKLGEATCEIQGALLGEGVLNARFDGEGERRTLRVDGKRVLVHDAEGQRWRLDRVPAYAWHVEDAAGGNQVLAPMPGRIVVVKANPGDTVEQGQDLLVMEAMKMELALKAPRAGTLADITAAQGDFVEADTILVRFVE